MGVIFHKGKKYGGTGVKVQSDASATSLNPLDVPNGQTIESVLNSNFVKKSWTLLQSGSGTPNITFPAGAEEIYFTASANIGSSTWLVFDFVIVPAINTSTFCYHGNGYYRTSSDYAHSTIYCNNQKITNCSLTYCGAGQTVYWSAYYR